MIICVIIFLMFYLVYRLGVFYCCSVRVVRNVVSLVCLVWVMFIMDFLVLLFVVIMVVFGCRVGWYSGVGIMVIWFCC